MTITRINLVAYNPLWPEIYENEAASLRSILKENCLEVHHIGSTSIPKMIAKEKIDILCIVDNLENSKILEKHLYTFKGEINIPFRYFFAKRTEEVSINLHVVERNHGFIELNLCFRDYLRNHEQDIRAYNTLKESLLEEEVSHQLSDSGFKGYTLFKNEFIKNILAKANYTGTIINFCTHKEEWDAYHRLCEDIIYRPNNLKYDKNNKKHQSPNRYFFVLYQGTTITTIAQIELLNNDEAALRALATDPAYQKLGRATTMLLFLEKWVKSMGRTVLKMHSSKMAEPLYKKHGYMPIVFDEPQRVCECVDLGKRLL